MDKISPFKNKMKVVVDKYLMSDTANIQCVNCKTVTKHFLTKSKSAYVCACGTAVTVEFKEDKNGKETYSK